MTIKTLITRFTMLHNINVSNIIFNPWYTIQYLHTLCFLILLVHHTSHGHKYTCWLKVQCPHFHLVQHESGGDHFYLAMLVCLLLFFLLLLPFLLLLLLRLPLLLFFSSSSSCSSSSLVFREWRGRSVKMTATGGNNFTNIYNWKETRLRKSRFYD